MRKMIVFALFGGVVGAGIAISRLNGEEDPAMADDSGTMKAVGSGAAAGAFVGLLFDRRARKKAKMVARHPKVAATMATVAGAAKAAKPRLEHAVEAAQQRLSQAA